MTKNTSTLTVPFIFEAMVIKPRCRKPVMVKIKDEVDIQFKTIKKQELTPAFKVGEQIIYYNFGKLWTKEIDKQTEQTEIQFSEVIKHTKSNGETIKYSRSTPEAPFKNFWAQLRYSKRKCFHQWGKPDKHPYPYEGHLDDEDLLAKDEIVYREYVVDNRELVLNELEEIVQSKLVVDGVMYRECNEPRYEVANFGAGHDYSVALFITASTTNRRTDECYYNALNLDKAKEFYRKKMPCTKGDISTNCGNIIEVILPEAVKHK
ncbi:hypothetical protein [Pseudoalteromonas marina]|uniref:Uncharacterized protein n=1 Tax=Pseudoalteromonas marina TaxID=267375 RepID=A0ABT9FI92_9GAMM|nr:hypothetical protein [Pseudoalteromonas marina]MDP2566477.1 hypothetical protein [Pseudoalteromonas marina]